MARPKFDWASPLASHRVDSGLIAAGAFLYNALLAIEHASDRETAFLYLREIGVRWYVATDLGTPCRDPSHGSATYTSGRVAIYDVR